MQVAWSGDILLFRWSVMRIYYKYGIGKGGSIVVSTITPNEFKEEILFEIPMSGKGHEKYSMLDKNRYGNDKMYKYYSNMQADKMQDFYWSLSSITHKVLVAIAEKMAKREKQRKKEENNESLNK
jgi:hypothetical protein